MIAGNASSEACLYAALSSPAESHDRLLHELIAPIVAEIRDHDDLDSLFFVRYAEPDWQLRLRVLGRPEWIERSVRPRVNAMIRPFVQAGVIGRVVFGEYVREWDRYGGPEGMRLAEKIFLYDSLACLEVLEAERTGACAKTRREYSLAFTERFLDLLGFDGIRRVEFYRVGHAWAFRDGTFRDEDRPRLDRQYESVREGLHELLDSLRAGDSTGALGGEEPRRIAERCLEASRPVLSAVLAAHAAGTIRPAVVDLAWSYAHLHCNRLGIDVVPEAILRYLMFRLYAERAGSGSPS